jgi:hypothetical protein
MSRAATQNVIGGTTVHFLRVAALVKEQGIMGNWRQNSLERGEFEMQLYIFGKYLCNYSQFH